MRIIVESGLLYSTTAFITFVTFVTGSSGVYVITDAVRTLSNSSHFLLREIFSAHIHISQEIQIVGIAFNMIIIRASMLAGLENEGTTMGRSTRDVPLQIVQPGVTSTTDSKMEVHVLTTQYSVDNFSKTERDAESQMKDTDSTTD